MSAPILSKSLPNLDISGSLDKSSGSNAAGGTFLEKKHFMYRGKMYDTTHALDKSILKERDHMKKMAALPPLPCSASYTNLGSWEVDNSAIPEVQDAYITVVKHVLFREVAVQGLASLVRRCDETYWKYANMKVDAIEKNKSATGEPFNILLRTLARLQTELAVAMAHLRSLSVCVVEEVMEWRMANRKNKMTDENVSLFWKKENYLIKMITDLTKILDVPIIWMWVGCEINPFLIPPSGHNPADSWRAREEMYQEWLRKHKEHVQRALLKMKELTRVAMGRPSHAQQRATTPVAPLAKAVSDISMNSFSEQNEDQEETKWEERGQRDANIPAEVALSEVSAAKTGADRELNVAASFVMMNNRSSRLQQSSSMSPDGSESATRVEGEGAEQRKSAMLLSAVSRRPSGGTDRVGSPILLAPKSSTIGSMEMLEEAYAEDVEQSDRDDILYEDGDNSSDEESDVSEVSEARKSLRKLCMDSWLCMKGSHFEEGKDPFWDNMDYSAVVIQAAIGFTETLPKKILLPQLQHGIVALTQHLEGELHREVRAMNKIDSYRSERMKIKKNVLSAVEAQGIEWALHHSKSWHAFEAQSLLKFRQQYCPPALPNQSGPALPAPHPMNEGGELPRGFSRGDGGERPRSAGDCLPSFSKFHESAFDIFLTAEREDGEFEKSRTFTPSAININKEKALSRTVKKVEEDRTLTAHVRDSVVVVKSRKSRRAMVERMRVTPAAIIIQAFIRGCLRRIALARKKTAMRMFNSALLIQSGIRRIVARHRARRLKLFLRRDGFIARKEVLKKNKCAFTVTKFMRWAAFIVRKAKRALQISSISKDSVRQQLQYYGKGSLKVQSMFRGHMARKRVASLVLPTSDSLSAATLSSTESLASIRSETHDMGRNKLKAMGMPARPGLVRHASSSNMIGMRPVLKQSLILASEKKRPVQDEPNPFADSDDFGAKSPKNITIDTTGSELNMITDCTSEPLETLTESYGRRNCNKSIVSNNVSNSFQDILDPAVEVQNCFRMRAVRPEKTIPVMESIFTNSTTFRLSPGKEGFPPTPSEGFKDSSKSIGKPPAKKKISYSSGKKVNIQKGNLAPVNDGMKSVLRSLLSP